MLRWLVTTYPEPSTEDVKEYCYHAGCSMAVARAVLEKDDTKVLQYLNENQEWVDVPTETILGEVT